MINERFGNQLKSTSETGYVGYEQISDLPHDDESEIFHCKLKCRGCSPDTVTADGKADRNFARFVQLRAKGL